MAALLGRPVFNLPFPAPSPNLQLVEIAVAPGLVGAGGGSE
jgi:hypothetical protein